MGLDNIWKLPQGVEEPTFDPPLRLCGGLLSGNGQGSFRGKVYNEFIENITGLSLYQDKISNENILLMAEKLSPYLNSIDEELKDLARMFETYALIGAELIGWW